MPKTDEFVKYYDRIWSLVDEGGNVSFERIADPETMQGPTTFLVKENLFDEDVPFSFIGRVYREINSCSDHKFIIPIKSLYRVVSVYEWIAGRRHEAPRMLDFPYLPNVCIALKIIGQEDADGLVAGLRRLPVAHKALFVDSNRHLDFHVLEGIETVIIQGSNNVKNHNWINALKYQCAEAGVTCVDGTDVIHFGIEQITVDLFADKSKKNRVTEHFIDENKGRYAAAV
ncbi:MAG: hypothetical protein CSYNP_04170 [Syntrophus sp. SKADARSKE-3]|nr:hypothetical protein [Syntrophus sp. SKADARSKE-3]